MKLLFASRNKNKLAEIQLLLPASIHLVDLDQLGVGEELPESSGTIKGNAIQKAVYAWEKTGIDCFADDSGLEVDVLGGKPGVDTAFFAGIPRNDARNMMFLLDQLEGVLDRKARFITVIALVMSGELHVFEGVIEGHISNSVRGVNGFGYDPVFIPDGYNQTFGELADSVKHSISHRSRAIGALLHYLRSNLVI
jgi:XTP/dITP diphosphohydrolase